MALFHILIKPILLLFNKCSVFTYVVSWSIVLLFLLLLLLLRSSNNGSATNRSRCGNRFSVFPHRSHSQGPGGLNILSPACDHLLRRLPQLLNPLLSAQLGTDLLEAFLLHLLFRPGLAVSLVALFHHARTTHHLAANMCSDLLSLFQAFLPDGADIVADLLLAAEVGPVPVHTVGEAAGMLTCVSCKLVLLPVARVPAELSPILYHLLSASITVPVESLGLGDLLVWIARLCSTPGHQMVLLPGSAVSQSLRILLHHLTSSRSVPHESLRPSCRLSCGTE